MRTRFAATLLLMSVSGCAADEKELEPPSSADQVIRSEVATPSPTRSAFRRLAPKPGEDEWEIEHFTSLRQLVARSDLVVLGTVTGGHWGDEYRESEADAPEDVEVARDLVYEVRVDGIISSRGGSAPARLDAVMDLAEPPFVLDPPTGEQAVFFLRRIGAPIPGVDPTPSPRLLATNLYRPVSSIGVLDEDQGQLAFPMGGGADWAVDFLKLPWDKAIARLEELAGP